MPRGMVWPLTVVVPEEIVTVPRLAGMADAPVYCTLPSGPSW
jgi:hypothetical protein